MKRSAHSTNTLNLCLLGGLSVLATTGAAAWGADQPRSYYPVISKADLQICRTELAASQADFIAGLRADQQRFTASDPESAAEVAKELARVSRQDPVSYWADADTHPITRLQHLNEYPELNYKDFQKFVQGVDENYRPQSEDKSLSAAYWGGENCVARMWIAKFNKMHGFTTASLAGTPTAPPPGRKLRSSSGGFGLSGMLSGPAASPPIVGTSVAETRSAPGGVSLSGPSQVGVSSIKSPKIGGALSTAKSTMAASGTGTPAPRPTADFTPVSECVSIEQSRSHPFANKCGFKVFYTYCVLSPRKGAWSEAFKCEDQKFGNDTIGANSVNGAQNTGGVTTYWFACRFPQLPIAKYERGRGAVGVCK